MCSPRGCGGRSCSVGGSSAKVSGGGRSESGKELVDRSVRAFSELLDPTSSSNAELRTQRRGHRGRSDIDGQQLLRRRDSPATASGRNLGAGRGATSELRSQGASRGLGEAAARLVVDWGAAGRRGRGDAVLCAGRSKAGRCARVLGGAAGGRWHAGEGQGAFKEEGRASACATDRDGRRDLRAGIAAGG